MQQTREPASRQLMGMTCGLDCRYTVVHVAAQYGQTALLYHVALRWEADVDSADEDGRAPLHWAAYKGFADTIRLLLVMDARMEQTDKEGCTPLHWAAIRGNGEACTILLQVLAPAAGLCWQTPPAAGSRISPRLTVVLCGSPGRGGGPAERHGHNRQHAGGAGGRKGPPLPGALPGRLQGEGGQPEALVRQGRGPLLADQHPAVPRHLAHHHRPGGHLCAQGKQPSDTALAGTLLLACLRRSCMWLVQQLVRAVPCRSLLPSHLRKLLSGRCIDVVQLFLCCLGS